MGTQGLPSPWWLQGAEAKLAGWEAGWEALNRDTAMTAGAAFGNGASEGSSGLTNGWGREGGAAVAHEAAAVLAAGTAP